MAKWKHQTIHHLNLLIHAGEWGRRRGAVWSGRQSRQHKETWTDTPTLNLTHIPLDWRTQKQRIYKGNMQTPSKKTSSQNFNLNLVAVRSWRSRGVKYESGIVRTYKIKKQNKLLKKMHYASYIATCVCSFLCTCLHLCIIMFLSMFLRCFLLLLQGPRGLNPLNVYLSALLILSALVKMWFPSLLKHWETSFSCVFCLGNFIESKLMAKKIKVPPVLIPRL